MEFKYSTIRQSYTFDHLNTRLFWYSNPHHISIQAPEVNFIKSKYSIFMPAWKHLKTVMVFKKAFFATKFWSICWQFRLFVTHFGVSKTNLFYVIKKKREGKNNIGSRMKYGHANRNFFPSRFPSFLVTGRTLSDQIGNYSLVPKNELHASWRHDRVIL